MKVDLSSRILADLQILEYTLDSAHDWGVAFPVQTVGEVQDLALIPLGHERVFLLEKLLEAVEDARKTLGEVLQELDAQLGCW